MFACTLQDLLQLPGMELKGVCLRSGCRRRLLEACALDQIVAQVGEDKCPCLDRRSLFARGARLRFISGPPLIEVCTPSAFIVLVV